MKLYFAIGACSLSDHIALIEAGLEFEAEAVDIHAKRTASGMDFLAINPKGYVPALVLDNGEVLTENVAVLDWIAQHAPALAPDGPLGRTRQLEMLAFIASEIHHAFKPFWHGGSEGERQSARANLERLFQLAATQQRGDYLFGENLSVADCYLYVTLRWAEKFGVTAPQSLLRLQWRMEARPAVQAALAREKALAPPSHTRLGLSAEVTENPAQHRFERPIHDSAIAAAYYRDAEGELAFIHTEVPSEFSGQGIATELARGTFEILRESGRKATLVCPFMLHFYAKHPEYADVVVG
ncbi:MAG TPA: N-acetyltransferase [Caulobacterales bacterium]|nr:N-acetyltransferase [Caulobacterales bacterium]